jgi:hypothetical protein
MYGPGSAGALFTGADIAANQNAAMTIVAAGANPAAGNTPLDIGIFYEKVPVSFPS